MHKVKDTFHKDYELENSFNHYIYSWRGIFFNRVHIFIKIRKGVLDKRNCNLVSWKNWLPSTNERTCRGVYMRNTLVIYHLFYRDFALGFLKKQCHVWFPENFSVGKINWNTFLGRMIFEMLEITNSSQENEK